MTTISAKASEIERKWFAIDAQDKILGRMAAEIARRLRGKHKAVYTPNIDTGDYIIVVNAEKVKVTGTKSQDKIYYRHTGYPGGLKETNFEKLQQEKPEQIIEKAVQGMLPKTKLGRAMFKKLKVYAGPEHPHVAQLVEPLTL